MDFNTNLFLICVFKKYSKTSTKVLIFSFFLLSMSANNLNERQIRPGEAKPVARTHIPGAGESEVRHQEGLTHSPQSRGTNGFGSPHRGNTGFGSPPSGGNTGTRSPRFRGNTGFGSPPSGGNSAILEMNSPEKKRQRLDEGGNAAKQEFVRQERIVLQELSDIRYLKRGLVNGGRNVCFGNATIQALRSVQSFTTAIVNRFAGHDSTCSCFSCHYTQILNTLNTHGNDAVNAVKLIQDVAQNMVDGYKTGTQQDAIEFSQRLRYCIWSPFDQSTEDVPDCFAFGEQTITRFEQCQHLSTTDPQARWEVVLELTSKRDKDVLNLSELVQEYFGEEDRQAVCSICHGEHTKNKPAQPCKASKQLAHLSSHVVFAINRNRQVGNAQTRVNCAIDLDKQIELKDFVAEGIEANSTKYELLATVDHFGETLNFGHYTATVFGKNENVVYDDENCRPFIKLDPKSHVIAIYRQIDTTNAPLFDQLRDVEDAFDIESNLPKIDTRTTKQLVDDGAKLAKDLLGATKPKRNIEQLTKRDQEHFEKLKAADNAIKIQEHNRVIEQPTSYSKPLIDKQTSLNRGVRTIFDLPQPSNESPTSTVEQHVARDASTDEIVKLLKGFNKAGKSESSLTKLADSCKLNYKKSDNLAELAQKLAEKKSKESIEWINKFASDNKELKKSAPAKKPVTKKPVAKKPAPIKKPITKKTVRFALSESESDSSDESDVSGDFSGYDLSDGDSLEPNDQLSDMDSNDEIDESDSNDNEFFDPDQDDDEAIASAEANEIDLLQTQKEDEDHNVEFAKPNALLTEILKHPSGAKASDCRQTYKQLLNKFPKHPAHELKSYVYLMEQWSAILLKLSGYENEKFYCGIGWLTRPLDHLILAQLYHEIKSEVKQVYGKCNKSEKILDCWLNDGNVLLTRIEIPCRAASLTLEHGLISLLGRPPLTNLNAGETTSFPLDVKEDDVLVAAAGLLLQTYDAYSSVHSRLVTDKVVTIPGYLFQRLGEDDLHFDFPRYGVTWSEKVLKLATNDKDIETVFGDKVMSYLKTLHQKTAGKGTSEDNSKFWSESNRRKVENAFTRAYPDQVPKHYDDMTEAELEKCKELVKKNEKAYSERLKVNDPEKFEKRQLARKRSYTKYLKSEKGKETRAKYLKSEKGKEVVAKYQKSDKRKESRVKYLKSEKGKETRAKYQKSDKRKESRAKYEKSDKRKEVVAKYLKSEKGKEFRARTNAKQGGYSDRPVEISRASKAVNVCKYGCGKKIEKNELRIHFWTGNFHYECLANAFNDEKFQKKLCGQSVEPVPFSRMIVKQGVVLSKNERDKLQDLFPEESESSGNENEE